MAEKRIRVAIVGAGRWGGHHARVFAARPDVELCAVVGRTPQKTQARAAQYGIRWYLDIQEMLDQETPDLVTLSLPNQGHFEPTLQVIRAGFPLLAEKPLAFDLGEADILLEEAERRSLFFAINFCHRYARPVQMAKQAIEAGKLGDPVFATWRFGGDSKQAHPFANLIETQCHGFDMLEHLCGPIDSVMAQMTDKTGQGFSTMSIALHFANGAVGSLVGSYDSAWAYGETQRLELNGTAGRVLVHDTVRRYTFTPRRSETSEVWESGYFHDEDRQFHLIFDYHVDALLTAFKQGQAPPVHARAGRRALELATACIRSYESGQRVAVGGK